MSKPEKKEKNSVDINVEMFAEQVLIGWCGGSIDAGGRIVTYLSTVGERTCKGERPCHYL